MRTRIVWTPHELELVAEEAARLLTQGAARTKVAAVNDGQKRALTDKSRWRTISGEAALRSIEFPLAQALSRLKQAAPSQTIPLKSSNESLGVPTTKPRVNTALLKAKLLASAQQFVDTLIELLDAKSPPSKSETKSIVIDPVQVLQGTATLPPWAEESSPDEDYDLEESDSDVSPDSEAEDGKPSPDETPARDSKPVTPFGVGFNDEWMTVAFAGVEDDIRKLIESSYPSGLNFVWFETTTAGVQLFSKTLDNKAFPIDYCLLKTGKQSTAFHLLATRRMQQRCLVVTGVADIRNRLEFLIKKERRVRNETET
jgi:hypothetical protein